MASIVRKQSAAATSKGDTQLPLCRLCLINGTIGIWPKSSRLKITHYEKIPSRGLTPITSLASPQKDQLDLRLTRQGRRARLSGEGESQTEILDQRGTP